MAKPTKRTSPPRSCRQRSDTSAVPAAPPMIDRPQIPRTPPLTPDELARYWPRGANLYPSLDCVNDLLAAATKLRTVVRNHAIISNDANASGALAEIRNDPIRIVAIQLALVELEPLLNPLRKPFGAKYQPYLQKGWPVDLDSAIRAINIFRERLIEAYAMQPMCEGYPAVILSNDATMGSGSKASHVLEVQRNYPQSLSPAECAALDRGIDLLENCLQWVEQEVSRLREQLRGLSLFAADAAIAFRRHQDIAALLTWASRAKWAGEAAKSLAMYRPDEMFAGSNVDVDGQVSRLVFEELARRVNLSAGEVEDVAGYVSADCIAGRPDLRQVYDRVLHSVSGKESELIERDRLRDASATGMGDGS